MSETVQFNCPNCGAEIAQTSSFCPECGTRIRTADELIQGDAVTEARSQDGSGFVAMVGGSAGGAPAPTAHRMTFDLTKVGLVERILAAVGVLALVDSFLPWYTVSVPFLGGIASANGWTSGFGSWLPVLVLVALGALAVLPAFGVGVNLRGGYLLYAMAAAFAALVIVIWWAIVPATQGVPAARMSVVASVGLFLGLGAAVAATAFAYLGFVRGGGSLGRFKEAFAKAEKHVA